METLSPEQIEQLQQANEALQRQLASQHMWISIYGWSILMLFVLFVVAVGVAYWLWQQYRKLQEKLSSSVSNHQRTHTAYTQKEAEYNSLSLDFSNVRQERDQRSHELAQLQQRYRQLDLQHVHTRGELWHLLTIDGGDNWLRYERDGRQIRDLRIATEEEVAVIRSLERLHSLGLRVTPELLEGLEQAGFQFDERSVAPIPAGNRPIIQSLVSAPPPAIPSAPRRLNPPPRQVPGSRTGNFGGPPPIQPMPQSVPDTDSPDSSQPMKKAGDSEWTRFSRALGGNVPSQPPGEPSPIQEVLDASPLAQPESTEEGM